MVAVTGCSGFRAQGYKLVTLSIFSSSICHEVMGPDAMILVELYVKVICSFAYFFRLIIFVVKYP